MERYSVIRRLTGGSSLRVCTANDFTEAKRRMLDEACQTGQVHFVYDFELGRAVAASRETSIAVCRTTE